MHDCLEWPDGRAPVGYQDEILAELETSHREAVRGPHGLGKTALAAWSVLHFALTRDALGIDWKCPTTASGWRHLTKFLWPEIHKWARKLRWDLIGREPFDERVELQQLNLKLLHGEAFAVASNRAELIEGAHADSLFYLFDEAKAIPTETFDAAEGAFSGAGSDTALEAFALAISTPGEPQGRFYDIHRRRPGYEDWSARHVKLEDAVAAGRISQEWANQRERQWGKSSAVFQNRVLGNFAASDEDSIIPLAWIEAAIERWHEAMDDRTEPLPALTRAALDVSDGGLDRSILGLRHAEILAELRDVTQTDPHSTMALVGILKGVLESKGGEAIIDSIGVGAGVVSRAREQGLRVIAFNASEGTDLKDESGELGFLNLRAAVWWGMREKLNPDTEPAIALPDDDELVGDLTAPHWSTTSAGKIKVEPKDEIKARIGRSTDRGDTAVMAFAEFHRTVRGLEKLRGRTVPSRALKGRAA